VKNAYYIGASKNRIYDSVLIEETEKKKLSVSELTQSVYTARIDGLVANYSRNENLPQPERGRIINALRDFQDDTFFVLPDREKVYNSNGGFQLTIRKCTE